MAERNWLTLKETQQAFLELLGEFDAICAEHHLRYDLCGGSMLGAVRHQGFIPWDDDIDVAMPRPDYERFLQLALDKKLGLKPGRSVISRRDKSFARHYARYVRHDIGSVQELFLEEDSPYLGMDIFTVDGMPITKPAMSAQVWIIRQLRKLMLTSVQQKNASRRSKKVAAVKNILQPVLRLIGPMRLAAWTEWWCRRVPYDRAVCVGILNGMYGKKERWLKTDMLQQKLFPFEGKFFPGYTQYEIYLTNLYGDFRKLPPEEQRKPHGASAFWITESV